MRFFEKNNWSKIIIDERFKKLDDQELKFKI